MVLKYAMKGLGVAYVRNVSLARDVRYVKTVFMHSDSQMRLVAQVINLFPVNSVKTGTITYGYLIGYLAAIFEANLRPNWAPVPVAFYLFVCAMIDREDKDNRRGLVLVSNLAYNMETELSLQLT